ncbi:hypothetical protein CCACVL1_06516 [Corchorus capsularis]|uniref:Uncharacterized protein n=1 Tax=Corchorus capsularis TaxID=210143 RepID=A0A1R3JEY2_COCAP|nr:hypothetical protein CCACVL1_06516 [Corchorus capsularis]
MAIAERLAEVGEEIQRVENDLRKSRRLLPAFWGHLLPRNPTVIGERMGRMEQKIRDLEGRLRMLRNEQKDLIVQAVVTYGDCGDTVSPVLC